MPPCDAARYTNGGAGQKCLEPAAWRPARRLCHRVEQRHPSERNFSWPVLRVLLCRPDVLQARICSRRPTPTSRSPGGILPANFLTPQLELRAAISRIFKAARRVAALTRDCCRRLLSDAAVASASHSGGAQRLYVIGSAAIFVAALAACADQVRIANGITICGAYLHAPDRLEESRDRCSSSMRPSGNLRRMPPDCADVALAA